MYIYEAYTIHTRSHTPRYRRTSSSSRPHSQPPPPTKDSTRLVLTQYWHPLSPPSLPQCSKSLCSLSRRISSQSSLAGPLTGRLLEPLRLHISLALSRPRRDVEWGIGVGYWDIVVLGGIRGYRCVCEGGGGQIVVGGQYFSLHNLRIIQSTCVKLCRRDGCCIISVCGPRTGSRIVIAWYFPLCRDGIDMT